jgi:hypothetical protein
MRIRQRAAVGILVALLGLVGLVTASNTAAKFTIHLPESNKIYTVSLPQNSKYTNAGSVFEDIDTKCGTGTAAMVQRIVPSVGGGVRVTWVGFGGAADNFSISKDEGYLVQVNQSCDWVLVGSHDDEYTYTFSTAGYDYLVNVPFNSTADTADELFTSIPYCSKVERINPSAGGVSRTTWLGFGGAEENFPVVAGEAYIVRVSAASWWTPAHY